MKQINNKHDKFFKEIFSYANNTRDFIEGCFPPALAKKMELNTLQIENASYIHHELKESFSDLVYSCNYGTNKKVKVCLLFEHKSKQANNDVFQILFYIANAYRLAIKLRKRPEIVLPIVFYHGEKPWKKQAFHKYFGQADEILCSFIPIFDYVLVDMSQWSNEQIEDIYQNKEILRASLILLKNIKNFQTILEKVEKIFSFAEALYENKEIEYQIKSMYIYLFNNLSKEEAMKTIEKLKKTTIRKSKGFVSYADTLLMEGMEKGMEKGIEKGIEKGATIKAIDDVIKMNKLKFAIEIIMDLSGFNQEQVQQILSLVKKHPQITPDEIYKKKFEKY